MLDGVGVTCYGHQHKYYLNKRVGRVVIYKCKCGEKKTYLITNFTPEKAESYDSTIREMHREQEEQQEGRKAHSNG